MNYIGNKYRLLPQIIPYIPDKISMFADLFGGSGVVSLNTKAYHYSYNDVNPYVTEILEGIKSESIKDIIAYFEKQIERYQLSKSNKLGFDKFRNYYNKEDKNWKNLFLLMCFSFNNQFRFNTAHEYNSSFGWHKSIYSDVTISKLRTAKNKFDEMDIVFKCDSFIKFDFSDFDENDFVYCDPPYYNSLGNYNDGKRGFEGWTVEHESELLNLLLKLNQKGVRWLLSNNFTCNAYLEKWASNNKFIVINLNYDYSNSNYQRKDKNKDREVLIKNYI